MPRVSILRRELSTRTVAPGQVDEQVAVTFSTAALPPRTVFLPAGNYRDPTDEELARNALYRRIPKDAAAEEAEKEAIRDEIERAARAALTSYDL